MKITRKLYFLFLMLVLSVPVLAQAPDDDPKEGLSTAKKRADSAAKVFNDMMSKPDSAIPKTLLDKAEAVIIIPGAVRAAFGIGGRGGRGVVVRRTATGWGEPAFVKMGGGSLGAQIGVSVTDYIMLVMNEGGLEGLMQDEWEIGGDVGAVAGPVGREAGASTNVTLDAEILSYSKAKGLYVGAALKGAKLYPDNALNNKVYNMDAKEILSNEQGKSVNQMKREVRAVPQALARHSPKKS
ncbi:MAG TPA: lipid-binding SYLF domain-containing protein [Pyrinomonadaceae bacterium]|nr:lipid-binding SYLF domain-containing protein [Pyrinomonadaceae bacterium]